MKHTIETRQKMSEAHKGVRFTEEHCLNISMGKEGHTTSAETRQKMREAKRGRKKWAESSYKYFSEWPGSGRGWGPITRPAFDESAFPGQDAIEIRRAS
jgi:hypothetical protein